jgi:hypothetical protein
MVNESRLPAILTTIINTKQTYIPVLIASTGSNLEAVMAGSIPEIRPINPANNVLKEYSHPKTNSKQYVGQYQCNNQTKKQSITPPIRQYHRFK